MSKQKAVTLFLFVCIIRNIFTTVHHHAFSCLIDRRDENGDSNCTGEVGSMRESVGSMEDPDSAAEWL